MIIRNEKEYVQRANRMGAIAQGNSELPIMDVMAQGNTELPMPEWQKRELDQRCPFKVAALQPRQEFSLNQPPEKDTWK